MAAPVFATGDVPTAIQVNEYMVNIHYARKLANTNRTSTTTLADDPDLTLPVLANAEYEFICCVFYQSQTATDIKWNWTAPSGSTCRFTINGLTGTTGAAFTDDQSGAFDYGTAIASSGIGSILTGMMFVGVLWTPASGGNLTLQWAQSTSGAATTVLAGSYMSMRRLF